MEQIQRLPSDVAAQIKASASLISLNNVVVGLLENTLDAGAQRIDIKVDFARASCWVQDDGSGIAANSFAEGGGLGAPFHTSNTQYGASFLGSNGMFLASVAAVSVLSITSRYQGSQEANALILRYAQSITRLLPAPEHMSLELGDHGTKVSVHDLFGNMAVRVKQRPSSEEDRKLRDKEWNSLCVSMTGCILAYGKPLHLTLRGQDSNHIFNIRVNQATQKTPSSSMATSSQLHLARSILQQAFPSAATSTWIPTSARTSTLHVQAIICSDPTPRSYLQFICIGNRYVPPDGDCEMLYETMNRVFGNSAFGKADLDDQAIMAEDYTKRQQQAYRPNIKQWPAFVMLIRLGSTENVYNTKRQDFLTKLSEIAAALATRFLTEHDYQPRRATQARNGITATHQESIAKSPSPRRLKSAAGKGENLGSKRLLPTNDSLQDLDFNLNLSADQPIVPGIILKDDTVFRSRFISSRNGSKLNLHSNHSTSVATREMLSSRNTVKTLEQEKSIVESRYNEAEHITPVSAVSKTERSTAQACELSSNQDEIFDWIDPKTRETICINTRTGCIVRSGNCQRPRTTNESISQLALSRTKHHNLPRITRSANGIAVLKDDSWAKRFLENWQNPVLENVPITAAVPGSHPYYLVRVEDDEDDSTFFSHVLANQATQAELRLYKTGLKDAVVISQVDSKFILVRMSNSTITRSKDMIVLIDQHAADERIRVEQLLEQLCSLPSLEVMEYMSPLKQRSAIDTIILQQPIIIEVQDQEYELFEKHALFFAQWGILYNISPSRLDTVSTSVGNSCQLTVLSLPSGIAQRCSTEPRLLLNLLRGEAWKEEERATTKAHGPYSSEASWVTKLHNCPSGILDLLNSRACRSAVMFNDVLTVRECKKIVSDLANCQFPFQCAHGRPSMVPLLSLDRETEPVMGTPKIYERDDFSSAWSDWVGRE